MTAVCAPSLVGALPCPDTHLISKNTCLAPVLCLRGPTSAECPGVGQHDSGVLQVGSGLLRML